MTLYCKVRGHSTNIHPRNSTVHIKIRTKIESVESIRWTEEDVASETSCMSNIPRIIERIEQFVPCNV